MIELLDHFCLNNWNKSLKKNLSTVCFSIIFPKVNFNFFEIFLMKKYEYLKVFISYVFVMKCNFPFSYYLTLIQQKTSSTLNNSLLGIAN